METGRIFAWVAVFALVVAVVGVVAYLQREVMSEDVPMLQFVSGTEYMPGEAGKVIVEARFANGTTAFNPIGNMTFVFGVYQLWPYSVFNTSNYLTSDPGSSQAYVNAFDGSLGTYWQGYVGGLGSSQWVILQLNNQSSFHLNDVVVSFYGVSYNADQFQIYGGDDFFANGTSGSWTYLGQELVDQASPNVTLNNTETKYKRYLINMSVITSPAYPAILEMFAYGYSDITTVLEPGKCRISIWYPNKTIFVNATLANLAPSGNQYIDFIVPNATGVYEYQAECLLRGNKTGIISKSFHVSEFQNDTYAKLNRIKAVMPK